MRGRSRVKDFDEQLVEKLYVEKGLSCRQIAKEVDASSSTINFYLKKKKLLRHDKSRVLKYSDDELKKRYLSGSSTVRLGQECGISSEIIRRRLNKLGVNMRHSRLFCGVNKGSFSDLFNNIDSEEKAYWLGFISADGYVTKNKGYKLAVELSDKDVLQLINFRLFLNKKSELMYVKDSLVLAYYKDKQLVQGLINQGLTHNKTFNLIVPNLRDDLLRHYYRGLIDGDGCFYFNKTGGVDFSLVGTKNVCESFLKFCDKNNIHNTGKISKQGSIYNCRVYGRYAKELSKLLYENVSISLRRKKWFYEYLFLNKSSIEIKKIVNEFDKEEINYYLKRYHYLGKSIVNEYFGYYNKGVLEGIMLVGSSPSINATNNILPKNRLVRCINRFYRTRYAKTNSSKLLAALIDFYSKQTDVSALITYADDVQGHQGIIYKAISALLIKKTNQFYYVLEDDSIVTGQRALQKVLEKKQDIKKTFIGFKRKYLFLLGSGRQKQLLNKELLIKPLSYT